MVSGVKLAFKEKMSGDDNVCLSCKGKKNRVAPVTTPPQNEIAFNSKERINGWSCPLHPLQITAWLFILLFGVVYFGMLVTYLPHELKAAGYIVSFD